MRTRTGAAYPPPVRSDKVPAVSTSQRYRLRNPASGREIVIEAQPEEIYLDRESGEPLEVVGKVLPLDDRFAPRFAENATRFHGPRKHFVCVRRCSARGVPPISSPQPKVMATR